MKNRMVIKHEISSMNNKVDESTLSSEKKNIILPIKPQYAFKILDGEKKYEYRKKLCKNQIDKIYVYATSPVKMIVGELEVANKICMDKAEMWEYTQEYAGITKKDYDKYFEKMSYACAYEAGGVKKYKSPVTLNQVGIEYVLQSYVYVPELEIE